MLAEPASAISEPGEAPWGAAQPSLPEAPPASGLPTREQIERVQLRKLRSLLGAIVPSNPFYARKLTDCGPVPVPASLEAYARTVPLTARHELVRDRLASPPYGTNLTFPFEAYVRCHQTSGTTTVAIRWLDRSGER